MPLGYIVNAHHLPDQLARLVGRLAHPEDAIYVHVDARFDIRPFQRALEPWVDAGAVRFAARQRVGWGSYRTVQTILDVGRELLAARGDVSHLVLLTGADYVCKPTAEIREHLARHEGRSLLSWSDGHDSGYTDENRAGNAQWRWDGSLDRLTCRCVNLPGRTAPMQLPNRYLPWFPRRRMPAGLTPRQGLGLWALTPEAFRYASDELERRPQLRRYFKRVLYPDEFVFQSILVQSPLAPRLVNRDLHWLTFAGLHPRVVTTDDVPTILSSPKLFARKFDARVDARVFDVIDDALERATISTP